MEEKTLQNIKLIKYKMTEREISEKYDNLSENELNKKDNKKVYVRNYIITNIIVHCRGENKNEEKEK